MKAIIKWVLFVPVCLLSSMLMLFTGLNSMGTFLGFTANTAAETVIFTILGMFVLFFIISLFDRTTSPVHLLKKNLFCGVTSIITAFLLAASAALDFTSMVREGAFDVMGIITGVFTLVAAVALLFVGLNHFSGSNTPKNISMLYLAIPLWCAVHLIDRFLQNTATPVAPADTLDLVLFVTMALFSIYAMMIHALIPGKNAVKSAITMGFPAVISAFVYSISQIMKLVNSGAEIVEYIPAIGYAVLGLYVLCFTAELSFTSKTTEEIVVVYPEDEYREDEESEENDAADSEPSGENRDNSEDSVKAEASEEPAFEKEAESEAPFAFAEVTSREADSEGDAALDELLRSAKEKDTKTKNSGITDDDKRGENMIIEGEKEKVAPQKKPLETAPTGKTVREAVMFDDDFIISLDSIEGEAPSFESAETKTAETEATPVVDENIDDEADSFSSRMDEIDKLILSIQGADIDESPENKE